MCKTELLTTFRSVDELDKVAAELFAQFPNEHFFAFFGKMGVGKTTLIKAMCSKLGVKQNVCSPTFAIINEYSTSTNTPVYHFDFYRIKSSAEAYDIGYEEYFYSGDFCFTEWTEKVVDLLPNHYIRIDIEENNGVRTLHASLVDA
ncbi:MAG: tRNA (adenosine(37)-N6)-threonylcarbamoyltransferase complex ATPase subunit type 1 TsaE [Bacteroidales bacterium]|nr:tRNA (adenosine(37)-N6)-threonylcarbamoyltransferase complex ATPase subunit type 1 TsaE [Bacteroidales bacterium]